MANALDDIYYIDLKDSLAIGSGFELDPSVPLPVRRGEDGDVDIKNITAERVLSAILTVAAHDAGNKHLDYYKKLLLSSRPEIKGKLMQAAILKVRNEEWDDADEMFASLISLFGDDMAVVLNRALYLDEKATAYRKSSMEKEADELDSEAEALYKSAMDSGDPPADAFFNAGFFYMKSQSFMEALGCFEAYVALTCDINDDELGESGIYKKERAQQIINYIKNTKICDEHFKKAYTLMNSAREEEGLEEIRLFLQSNPKVFNAWFLLGWGLRRLGRYGEARSAFEESLSIAKEEKGGGEEWKDALCNTYNELALCLMECGSIRDAKGALLSALDIECDNAKVISNLGFAALKEGKKDEARGYFQAALEYDKNDKIAREALASLQ